MTGTLTVPDVWVKLTALSDCLASEITRWGLPVPCSCTVVPGAVVATDWCGGCEGGLCGMAWTRLETMYPSTVFPQQDTYAPCTAPLAYTIELGIARCAPVGNEDGTPPSDTEWLDCAQVQMQDAQVMRAAVLCCFSADEVMFQGYTPFGPEGGCVGGTWSVAVSELAT